MILNGIFHDQNSILPGGWSVQASFAPRVQGAEKREREKRRKTETENVERRVFFLFVVVCASNTRSELFFDISQAVLVKVEVVCLWKLRFCLSKKIRHRITIVMDLFGFEDMRV